MSLRSATALLWIFSAAAAWSQAPALPTIIPAPAHLEIRAGSVDLQHGLVLTPIASDPDAAAAVLVLNDFLRKVHHAPLAPAVAQTGQISVTFRHRDPRTPNDESYALDAAPSGIVVTAGSRAGLVYGAITLWQMLASSPAFMPALHLEDEPRFRWRGLMLDSARHMQTEPFLYQLLDYMSQHKLNTLHWHLTDDQGWRLEIKRYPKLTAIGGFRKQTEPPYEPGSMAPTGPYGGFYTQAQVRRIVAYAQRRNITIVPEIEMPGHASAAIAAYPKLGSGSQPLQAVPVGWGIFPHLFNTSDATFDFLYNVLLEVMDLFPGTYIHVGGDEAIKPEWKSNPTIQAKMHALGVHDETALQGWFVQQIEVFLNAHGRRLIGWDEILDGGLSPNATVMSWRGTKGAVGAAQAGHDAVLTPSRPLYFNYRQSDAPSEPAGRDPVNSLEDVYRFNPLPDGITAAEQGHVLGLQGSIWSEYILTEDRVQHMLFPRAAAIAEVGWSPAATLNFASFLHRLEPDNLRSEAEALAPAHSVFEVRSTISPNISGDSATVSLWTQGRLGTIRCTVNGAIVSAESPICDSPFDVTFPGTLQAQAFDGEEPLGRPVMQRLTLETAMQRDSRELEACSHHAGIQMEQDPIRNRERPVFRVDFQHPCWLYPQAHLSHFHTLRVSVGSIPFIFRDPDEHPSFPQPGDASLSVLDIHVDTCQGPLLTSIPLAGAYRKDGVTTLVAPPLAPFSGRHDLCLNVRSTDSRTVWLLHTVQPQGR